MKENGLFASLFRRFKNRKASSEAEMPEEEKLSGEVFGKTADCEASRASGPSGEVMISDEQIPAPEQSRMTEEYAEWLKSQTEWQANDAEKAADVPSEELPVEPAPSSDMPDELLEEDVDAPEEIFEQEDFVDDEPGSD